MKRYTVKLIFSCVSIILLLSCTKKIDVTVPNGGERLVIEANMLWEKGTTGREQTIKLSKSTEFFADDLTIPALGVEITVRNDISGANFRFTEQGDGDYTSIDFVPVIGDSYTLEVVFENEIYMANETFISVTEITSFNQGEVNVFSGTETSITVFYEDPADVQNFYIAEFSNRRVFRVEPSSDEFYDGNQNFIEYHGGNLMPGVPVTISLQGVSERFYDYIRLLPDQNSSQGPFQTIPAQLKGNCYNINDPDEEVLGYFRLSEADRVDFSIN